MNITQIRERYPEYSDLTDRELAEGLWKKEYQDIPFESFSKTIGFDINKDNARASYNATTNLNPDKEAEGQKVSNQLGIPRQVVRENEQSYKKRAEEPDFNDLSINNPATTEFLGSPGNTSISRDDHEGLSNVENEYYSGIQKIEDGPVVQDVLSISDEGITRSPTFDETIVNAGKAIARFLPRAAYTLGRAGTNATAFSAGVLAEGAQAIENLTGLEKGGLFEWLQDWSLREAKAQGQVLQGDDEFLGFNLGLSEDIKGLRLIDNPQLLANPEWLIQNTGDALSSMIPIFATAYATGGSTAVAGLVGGLQEGTALFNEMMEEKEVSRVTALNAAISFGGVSAYLNRIGLDAILDKTPVKNLKSRIFRSFVKGGVEAATEWAEEPTQALIKALAEEDTPQEIIDQVIEGARNIDVIPGAFILGGGTAFVSQKKEIEDFETNKKNAADFKDLHSRVGTAMDNSKTKERSPENSEKFLNILGLGETGFISSDGAQVLFQENPEVVTEIMEKLGVDPEEAIEEISSGHDIPVTMSKVHARLSPEERNFIIDDLKQAPGAMSQRQVDEIDIEGSLADIADRFSDAIEDETGFQTELTRIKDEAAAAGVIPEQVEEFGTLIERFSERLALEGQNRVDTVSRIRLRGQALEAFEKGSEFIPAPRKKPRPGVTTLRGRIKQFGGIAPLNFKGEVKSLSVGAKFLFKKGGFPIDLAEEQLKREGWLQQDEDLLEVLRTQPDALKRGVTGVIPEIEARIQEEEEFEAEEPPAGNYVNIKAIDIEQGSKVTILSGKGASGWDVYEIESVDDGVVTFRGLEGTFEANEDQEIEVLETDLSESELGKIVEPFDLFQAEPIQPETEEFKAFFKDSKVVDDEGNPEVVFHGTAERFEAFDPERSIGGTFWFTNDKSKIEGGEVGAQGKGVIVDAFISIQNPAGWKEYDKFGIDELIGRGFDGLKLVDDDQITYVAFNPEQIKSASENIGTFDPTDPNIFRQEKEKKVKGAITITPEENIITIFKGKADLSTLLHETGHLFLNEMQSVVDIGTASEQFINDNNTIKEWLGFEKGQESFTTEQQEKFARGFEAYLFEGKAPSKDLENSFERFRKWLLSVYKSINALDVELNDEIRQVFDRMLVAEVETDLAVQENQMEMPSKATMDSLGIVPEDREFMKRLLKDAIFKAEQQLVKDRNKDNRSKRKAWKEKGREIALKRPEYQKLLAMSKGKGLNKQQMDYIYGKENIDKIPKTVPRVVRKDGQNLPEAALDFGYDTVDAMVEDLASVVPMQAFIDNYVQRQQMENDEKFQPNDYLIGTKEYGEFLSIMAKYENRGVTDVAPAKTFKIFAKKLFADYQIKKAIRTNSYLASLKKYSRIERKKAQQGKFGEASEANEKVRLNYELSGLSIKQRKLVEQLIKRSSRIIKSKTIKNEYKQQAVRVMQRFGLTKRNLVLDQDRPAIGEFFAKLTEGVDIEMWEMVPTYSDMFMLDVFETNYKNLTVDQFTELDDLIRYFEKRGRRVKKDRLSDGKTLVQEKVTELVQPMRARKRTKKIFPEDSILEKLTTATRRFFATQESLPFISRRLDGFVSIKGKIGPNEEAINNRLFDADNEFIDLVQEFSDKLNPIAEYFSKRVNDFPKRIVDTGVPVPENMKRGKERFWTFERILAIALNRGNSQNLQRITGGYLITNNDVDALTSILNEQDWKNVQEIWDIVNSLWPQLDAAFFRINDFHQKKVEAEEFITPTGLKLKGGYYPILFDRSLSTQIGEWTEKEDFMNSSEAMFQPANPKNGMLQSRATGKVSLPVKLDLNVLFTHVNTSIRYITHSEAVNDVNKIIRSEQYQDAVEKAEGQALYEMMRPALAEIARPNAIRLEHMDTIALREAQRATSYTLGLSRSVALKQPFSIFGFLNDVGDGNSANGVFWYMRGIGKVLVSPWDAYNGMRAASPFMRTRSDNVDRDLRRNIGLIKPGKKSFRGQTWDDVQNAMFMFIRAMDFATVFPSWQGAYQKGMKINNGDMAKAVRYADSQIRNSQPSSQEIDLNHLQRSRKGWHRFFTLFSTFTAKMGARQRYHYNAWKNGSISFARYTSIVTMEQVAPPIMMNLMFALMWGEEPDPEDVVLDVITYQFIGIFLIREFAGAVAGIFKGFQRDPFDSPVLIGSKLAIKLINDTIKWIEDLDDDEKLERSLLALLEMLAYGVRTPFPKIIREIDQGIEQYENGDGTAINVLVRNPKIRKKR